jgi:hypothetical protein
MRKNLLFWLSLVIILIVSCQKEMSFESSNSPAEGSLQADISGDCLPKTVNGSYAPGTVLNPATNNIVIQVAVTKVGSYTISTDTVNGYYFRATGNFTSIGNTDVTLRGNGTPFAAGVNNFSVSFDSTYCDIQVTVASSAAFTLSGAPNACTGATVQGAYAIGVPLTAANTATINVDVTTVGSYTISASLNGMTFSKSGVFTSTGPQQVILVGSGTPTTAGANVVPLTAGTSTCSFTVTVSSAGAGTLGGAPSACAPINVQGTYTAGTALDATNKVDVQVNVTTPGVFSISTNTLDGFSFSFSGNLATTGPQTVTLLGTGNPVAAGVQTFTVTLGTSTCTFPVTVAAVPVSDYFPRTVNSNWSYEFDDVSTDSLLVKVINNTVTAGGNPFQTFMETFDAAGVPPFDTSGYYRKAGNDYYQWANLVDYMYFNTEQWQSWIFLKDNQPAGTTWYSSTGGYSGTVGTPPTAVVIRIKFTILQKDVPISITTSTGTVNYPNTIVVEEKYELQNGPLWLPLDATLGYYVNYYSRNVGQIKLEYFDGTGGATPTNVVKLRRVEIY